MTDERVYLSLNQVELIKDLRNSVLEFIYVNFDGSQQTGRFTLSPAYMKNAPVLTDEEKEKRSRFLNEGTDKQGPVLHVWNVVGRRWTSFRLDKVVSCQITNW